MRESTIIDWRQRLDDILEEVESACRDEEDLSVAADLESVAEKLKYAGGDLENLQAENYG